MSSARHLEAPLAALLTLLATGCTLDVSGTGQAIPGAGGSISDGGGPAATGGSGGAGDAGGSGGSGGKAPPGPEKCGNQLDDNGDGLVDCDDVEACGDTACAGGIQQGFSEYFRVQIETFPAEAPAPRPCAEGGEALAFGEGLVETKCAMTEACQCSFGGATCKRPALACYRGNSSECTDESKRISTFPDPKTPPGVCAEAADPAYDVPPDVASCKIEAPGGVDLPGACAGAGSVALIDPRPFETALFACPVAPKGRCADGMCFAPQPGEGGLLCARFGGDVPCKEPGAKRHVVYPLDEHVETRACHGCTCTPESVSCGAGSVRFFDGDDCQPPPTAPAPDVVIDGACKDVGHLLDSGTASFRIDLASPTHTGCTVAPSSGTPAALATAGMAYTLCCVEAP